MLLFRLIKHTIYTFFEAKGYIFCQFFLKELRAKILFFTKDFTFAK